MYVTGISDGIDAGYTVVMLVISIIFPLTVVIFIKTKYERLDDKHFKEKYDSLYEEYEIRKRSSIYFIGYFFLRRLIFSAVCVYLIDYTTFQIQLYIFLSLTNLIFVKLAHPYETISANRIETFNELTILAVGIHMYIFTDFVDDSDR